MPNRILREGILTSERIALLTWQEEVFYRRLMSVVDDFGRYHANPKLLRAALYPLLIDKVSDADIGKWLTACVTAALVSVYPAPDGKRYLLMLDFRQQTRADKSRYPEPPADAQQMRSKCAADANVYGDGYGDGYEPPSVVARKRAGRRCPDDFDPGPEAKATMAAECPGVDLEAETRVFRDYTFATAKTDWDATWRNWVRKAAKNVRPAKSFRERDEQAAAARHAQFTGRKVDALDVIEMEKTHALIGNG